MLGVQYVSVKLQAKQFIFRQSLIFIVTVFIEVFELSELIGRNLELSQNYFFFCGENI